MRGASARKASSPSGGVQAGSRIAPAMPSSVPDAPRRRRSPFVKALAAVVLGAVLIGQPAMAQQVLRDAETEAFLREATGPLVKAAGLNNNVEIYVLNDPSINAMTAGGQYVWINSGLIAAADNINQVQGVVAHELGHIEGGHAIRAGEGMREATGVQIISMILGAAAIAAGGGEAGSAIIAGGQQAAIGKYLAFSRVQESSADAAATRYMHTAQISCKGFLDFFKKLENMEYRLYLNADSFGNDHPVSADRIATLQQTCESDPAWNAKTDPALQAQFLRIKAKLVGFVSDPPRTLQLYPVSDQSIPAHYARAFAYHKGAYPEQAMAEVNTLLKAEPEDPYFLELKGQILLESGKPLDAIPPLREAVARSGNHPLIATLLGHALVATEDDKYLDEAEQVLHAALTRDNENPFGWYVLGTVYARKGDTARAALASAEQFQLNGEDGQALRYAQMALSGIQPGTSDYLRAQDIAMTSRSAMEKTKKR